LLNVKDNKEKLEQHLMDMILENPVEAAETLAGLFAHDNQVKKFNTKSIFESLKYPFQFMTFQHK